MTKDEKVKLRVRGCKARGGENGAINQCRESSPVLCFSSDSPGRNKLLMSHLHAAGFHFHVCRENATEESLVDHLIKLVL